MRSSTSIICCMKSSLPLLDVELGADGVPRESNLALVYDTGAPYAAKGRHGTVLVGRIALQVSNIGRQPPGDLNSKALFDQE
jgi:hypothetical protein